MDELIHFCSGSVLTCSFKVDDVFDKRNQNNFKNRLSLLWFPETRSASDEFFQQPAWCFHLLLLYLLHPRSPAAPPAGDCVCTERSLPASGRLLGHLQRSAQCSVPALRDRDHAGSAPPAAAETWSVPAQHRPQGGLHTPAADTGHQHWVRAPGGLKLLHISSLETWSNTKKRVYQLCVSLVLQDVCRQVKSQSGAVAAGPAVQSAEEPAVSGGSEPSLFWKWPRQQQTWGQCRLWKERFQRW